MCLALLAWKAVPGYRLIAANNRDEFHWRKTEPAHRWPSSSVVAGRDKAGGGTWFGVTESGRTGLVTNVRNGMPRPSRGKSATIYRSRGLLVSDYLESGHSPMQFVADLEPNARNYQPFNLILSDRDTLVWATNWRGFWSLGLEPGVYGLSNGELDSDWPKVRAGKEAFTEAITEQRGPDDWRDGIFDVLADKSHPRDEDLPSTNVPRQIEKLVGPRFVQVGIYGTRASTVVTVPELGAPRIDERRFSWFGTHGGRTSIEI